MRAIALRANEQKTMADKKRLGLKRRLRYRFEAAVLFAVIGLFHVFGVDRASAIGGWLGRNLFRRIAGPEVGRKNIRIAFPDLAEAEIDAIQASMWDNLGRVAGEFANIEAFAGDTGQRLSIKGLEHLRDAHAKGRGVILATGHFANWELMPVALRNTGHDGAVVIRPPNSIYTVEWLSNVRRRYGMSEEITKGRKGVMRIFTVLRGGGIVGMLVDRALAEGVVAPLFGQQAMTTATPAMLSLRLGAPIVPAAIRRTRGAHFEIEVFPPLEVTPTGDDQADIMALTEKLNAFVETVVRGSPGHWLWMHDRWRMPRKSKKSRRARLQDEGAPGGMAGT